MTPAESSSGHAGPDRARETGPALHAHYRFILWLVPAVARFPRSQKFLLGDRIQGLALDVLEALIEATYTRQRDRLLARANLGIEKLRFLLAGADAGVLCEPTGLCGGDRGLRECALLGTGVALRQQAG